MVQAAARLPRAQRHRCPHRQQAGRRMGARRMKDSGTSQQAYDEARAERRGKLRGAKKGNSYMKGKTALASNVGNALLALDQEPELMHAFGYDEMLRTEVLLRPLFTPPDPHFVPRPITDADVTTVQAHLQWFGFRHLDSGS